MGLSARELDAPATPPRHGKIFCTGKETAAKNLYQLPNIGGLEFVNMLCSNVL